MINVEYSRGGAWSIGKPDKAGEVLFKQGNNPISVDDYESMKKHPVFCQAVKDGVLVVKVDSVQDKDEEKKAGAQKKRHVVNG